MTLVRWNPAREFANIERHFNHLFNSFSDSRGIRTTADTEDSEAAINWRPLTDILEEKDHYILRADLPGVESKDVKITLKDGMLTISGERQNVIVSDNERRHRMERSFGKFSRSFHLPEKVNDNAIKATFSNGQLEVVIPKAEEAKPREIEISLN